VDALDVLKKISIPNAVYEEISVKTDADVVIIDDMNAKKHAKYLKLPVTGTLGVLIKAKKMGYIEQLKPILSGMVQNNIYLSDTLISRCLREDGEE